MDTRFLGKHSFGSYKIVKIIFQAQDLTTGVWSNADPTAVTHEVETPDGVLTTYTDGIDNQIIHEATGVYYQGFDLEQSQTWRGRWYGTGAVQEPANWYLTVDANPFV